MLIDWIKSIIIFVIFASFVRYLLPDGAYLKYIQNTIGLVMILVVINPLMELFDLSESLQSYYFDEMSSDGAYAEDDMYLTELMEELVEEYISGSYGEEADVTVSLNDGDVSSVDIAFPDGGTPDIDMADLIEDISAAFDIDADVIHIV